MSSSETCGFQGNPDIYGIGIRVGFYAQALAAWYASFFMASEARTSQATNRLFLLAFGVVIIWYSTNTDQSGYAAELWCMCLIASCIKIVSQQRITRYSSRYVPFSLTHMGIIRSLTLAAAIYGNWFWWAGVNSFQPTPCGTYIFFFAMLNMYGGFEVFAKVWCVAWALQSLVDLCSFGHFVKLYFRQRGTSENFIVTMTMIRTSRQRQTSHAASMSSGSLNSWSTGTQKPGELQTVVTKDSTASSLIGTSLPTDVLNAEKYLRDVFMKSQESEVPSQLPVTLSATIQGLFDMLTFFWRHPELRGVWDVLVSHFEGVRCKSMQIFPLASRMIDLGQQGRIPDFRVLKIASDVQLAQLPLYTGQNWVLQSAFSLSIIAFSIIGIELTIVFNQITGLDEIFSVGQLVPFVIGVGGLAQVLWRKWRALSRNVAEEAANLEPTRYEQALLSYLEWRKEKTMTSHETAWSQT